MPPVCRHDMSRQKLHVVGCMVCWLCMYPTSCDTDVMYVCTAWHARHDPRAQAAHGATTWPISNAVAQTWLACAGMRSNLRDGGILSQAHLCPQLLCPLCGHRSATVAAISTTVPVTIAIATVIDGCFPQQGHGLLFAQAPAMLL